MRTDRLLGAILLAAAALPAHRLLDPRRAGPAGAATRAATEAVWQASILGAAVVLAAAFAVSRLVPGSVPTRAARAAADALARPPAGVFALASGGVAAVLSGAVALLVFGGLPTSVDEMSQLAHAAALASGRIGVETAGAPAAFALQNGVATAEGWVSIYPPLPLLALALGLGAGAAWIVGPLLTGAATAASALSFERLLGTRTGRAAGALLAVTPFWLLLGATHLSHALAATGLALVLWASLRAEEGSRGAWLLLGAGVGVAVAARPWIGLVASAAISGAVAGEAVLRGPPRARLARFAAVAAGGAPFAALLLGWNQRLFGAPLRLGYAFAFGPSHGLGLRVDPWGNRYGPTEALAYTGSDLVQLGAHLLASPMPALVLVAGALLLCRGRPVPRVALAWAMAAVAANAMYWHHGLHLGPRMLYESTPAWIALVAVAGERLLDDGRARGLAAWTLALTVAGSVMLAPATLRGAASASVASPPLPAVERQRAVVFVHGSWASRISARLAAEGMRRDSIETALRRNDVCAVDRYVRWRADASRVGDAPALDWEALPGTPTTLRPRRLSEGNTVRTAPDGPRDDACAREAASDRFGVVELEPLLWRSSTSPDVILARDLGPVANRALLADAGAAWVYVGGPEGEAPRLLPYEQGMELLWRGAAGSPLR